MAIPRRTFVALSAASAALHGQKTSEKPPLGIGFLGANHSHAEGKLKVVRASAEWRIVGVAESNPKVQEDVRALGLPLISRDELLHHPEISVVAVESAVRDHAPDGKAVLQAGKHLHLEKAPADNLPAFAEIVNLARQGNRILQVGYMWRYHPGVTKALEAAREGWLGDIYLVKSTIGNKLAPERRAEWGEFRGGVMFELGGHVIDPVVRLMGRPRKVTPILHTDGRFGDDFKDNTAAVLEWDKAIGIVQVTTLQPDSSRFRAIEIHGTNGSAIVNPIEPPGLAIDLGKAAGPYRKGFQTIPMPEYHRYADDFVELAAVVRGERRLRVTLDEDLLVEEVLLRASGMA